MTHKVTYFHVWVCKLTGKQGHVARTGVAVSQCVVSQGNYQSPDLCTCSIDSWARETIYASKMAYKLKKKKKHFGKWCYWKVINFKVGCMSCCISPLRHSLFARVFYSLPFCISSLLPSKRWKNKTSQPKSADPHRLWRFCLATCWTLDLQGHGRGREGKLIVLFSSSAHNNRHLGSRLRVCQQEMPLEWRPSESGCGFLVHELLMEQPAATE